MNRIIFKLLGIVVACSVLFPALSWSAMVGADGAATAVKTWLQNDPAHFGEPLGHTVKKVDTFKDADGNPVYHVVYLNPSGFVIVPAEDTVEPIIAFVAKGRFDPSSKNALGALVSRDLPSRVAYARRHGGAGAFFKAAHDKWGMLQRVTAPSPNPSPAPGTPTPLELTSVSSVWVAPFLPTLWNQQTDNEGINACYNYYTPPYGSGNVSNFPSGCVATAMAQEMYYYQFPTNGVGTNSFAISVNGSGTTARLRGGNGGGGAYVWSNMPPVPYSPTVVQCQAIGDLLFDAGVAVHMDYEDDGSGALVTDAQAALVSTFKFNNAILGGNDVSTYSLGSALTNMANPNLDARMPVIFGIFADPSDGHCIVCDGYGYSASTLYHHVNMGWAGEDNGWYALPLIDTSDGQGVFTNIDSCIYNVYPSGGGEIISGRIVDANAKPIVGATVTTSKSSINYSAVTDTNGIYALVKVPSSSSLTVSVSMNGYAATNRSITTGKSTDGGATGNVWGGNFSLVGSGPPLFTVQPQSQSLFAGTTAIFTANATGTSPLTYHWQKRGTNLTDGGAISGSATASLTVSNLSPASAANYTVTVSNTLSVTVSRNASLTVYTPTGTNLAQNGGFETGVLTDWSLNGQAGNNFVIEGAGYVHSGNFAFISEETNDLAYVSQTIPTTAGNTYLVSAWMNNYWGATPNEFSIAWNNSTLLDESDSTETNWINFQYVVTATSSQTALKFGFRDDDAFLLLDDVAVTNLSVASVPDVTTSEPSEISAELGATTNLVATASGSSPITYQWQLNGTNIPNATNLTLSVTNAKAINAGSYQLITVNAYGTVTNSIATLSIPNAPISFSTGGGGIQRSNRQVFLQLTGLAGQGPVIVDASTNLVSWTPIFTNASGFGTAQFTDSGATNLVWRFYRARYTNAP